ncbi:phosphotransferase family protein [Nocardia sp. CA2R105]|uniref:phosphotransferase family protein n=1 Tax=Nocardia coffeae TaxID=2873381 RepID=UPI001CA6C386|nr:phosphotransferase family protein [Nocardia coffeae]MBY8862328.1 phosphotransferase family protein [Nocardia coffeae]
MRQAPVFSKGRDLAATATALRPWLAARLDVGTVAIDDFTYPQGAGVSNETILFRARYGNTVEELVVRIAPAPEHQMFMEPRFRMQYDILMALWQNGTVRVPEALWLEEDSSILGRPFYVMRRMRGRVPVSMPVYNATGWLLEATPAQRRVLWEDAMAQLAAIHRVPAAELSVVQRPEHGVTGIQQHLSYWNRYATWALGNEIPDTVRYLLDWLDSNQPPETTAGPSWGDARIGNIMFDSEFRVVGVMDWEQASFVGPVADLGWWLLFDEAHSVGARVPRLDGLGTRAETITVWQEMTGRKADHLLWHEVFAGVKAGLLGLHSRYLAPLPPVDARPYSYLGRACELLGLPAPKDF